MKRVGKALVVVILTAPAVAMCAMAIINADRDLGSKWGISALLYGCWIAVVLIGVAAWEDTEQHHTPVELLPGGDTIPPE